jgi:hypothetical protein
MASNSSRSVLPGVNASHHGKNSRVSDVKVLMSALAWDLAAEDEPMNRVVLGIIERENAKAANVQAKNQGKNYLLSFF